MASNTVTACRCPGRLWSCCASCIPLRATVRWSSLASAVNERPISDNTLRAALLTLGYGPTVQTVHGFRATARTLLAETLEIDPLVIEAQLAHAVKDANARL
jgi:integrase